MSMPLLVPTLAHIGTAQGCYQGKPEPSDILLRYKSLSLNPEPSLTAATLKSRLPRVLFKTSRLRASPTRELAKLILSLRETPSSASRYDHVLYLFMATKALDFLLAFGYIVLDKET